MTTTTQNVPVQVPQLPRRYGYRATARAIYDSTRNGSWKFLGTLAEGRTLEDARLALHDWLQQYTGSATSTGLVSGAPSKREHLRARGVIA